MANSGANTNASQFFVTFKPLANLDGRVCHCVSVARPGPARPAYSVGGMPLADPPRGSSVSIVAWARWGRVGLPVGMGGYY